MKPTPVLLITICLFCNCLLPAQDSLLIQALEKNRYGLTLENESLSGAGADLLQAEAADNQFLLIGESHGLAEIPKFTAALFRQITAQGYRYFATETGPFTAELLEGWAQTPQFMDQLKEHLRQYPWSIPFYYWQEEAVMLHQIVSRQKQQGPVVWGLDQEFAGSPRMLLPKLLDYAMDEKGATVIRSYADQAQKGFATTIENGNPAGMFFYSTSADDFARIRSAINDDPRGQRLLSELEESWEIYSKYFQRQGYASNRQRAEMMKRHFWEYYRVAKQNGDQPKVLIKLGSNHTYRGANGLNVFDIGNFVNELASIERTGSFHLYVIGKQGTQNAYNPFTDESAKQQPYDARNYLDRIDIGPLLEASLEGAWTLFDLRPLRPLLFNKTLKELDPALEKLIWSYDAFLVIPEVHASLNIDE
ncbi:MAG: hypothetical protein R2824_32595 [Saprospiraceae bacterium]|nr:hypothetical protein [Lewinella sp.]